MRQAPAIIRSNLIDDCVFMAGFPARNMPAKVEDSALSYTMTYTTNDPRERNWLPQFANKVVAQCRKLRGRDRCLNGKPLRQKQL
jgi:hypothetical protein